MYLLGPERIISEQVADRLRERGLARSVNRIEGDTPVENAIAFARYEKGDFGWRVNIPGYNFALASTTRPADAAAAAPLATRGVFAPLLLTDDAEHAARGARELPAERAARATRATRGTPSTTARGSSGDDTAISVRQQAQVDAITELIPVQSTAP